jgi:hypothetical protein
VWLIRRAEQALALEDLILEIFYFLQFSRHAIDEDVVLGLASLFGDVLAAHALNLDFSALVELGGLT